LFTTCKKTTKPSNYETRSNKGSQEKREALGALNTKGFSIDRRGKKKGREEKWLANGNASKI
jgi:hypothetical protein